jgi:hypothetical protein
MAREQKVSRQWAGDVTVLPPAILFALDFSFITNELIFKGLDACSLNPSGE